MTLGAVALMLSTGGALAQSSCGTALRPERRRVGFNRSASIGRPR